MKSALVSLIGGTFLVRAAINLDGVKVAEPVTDDDNCPIDDPETYHPDQHDCPLECHDYSNIHSWIPYFSRERLERCKEPMLLHFAADKPLDDAESTILIRGCSLTPNEESSSPAAGKYNEPMENPKKDFDSLLAGGSLQLAPACANVDATSIKGKLELATSPGSGTADVTEVTALLQGMQAFFGDKDNCDESFLFAQHKQTVAGIFLGEDLGKPTVKTALEALANNLHTKDSVSNYTVAQLCGNGRTAEGAFGVSINTAGDLASVQRTVLEWSKGQCASNPHLRAARSLSDVDVFEIGASQNSLSSNGTTLGHNGTILAARWLDTKHLSKRETCRTVDVNEGDSCAALASRCGISGADFTKFNPAPNFCATLQPGDKACCSAGKAWKPPRPKPGSDGVCATHLIRGGDSCAKLAKQNGITVEDIEHWNQGKTWAWTECRDMLEGYNMCLSPGAPPMPPPQKGTQCGPLVPGTKRPRNKQTSLADLNPCPLKACCSNWGFCGVFPAHCDVHAPEGGGPGSKKKGFQNTCVSNCGNEIKKKGGPPTAFQRIGYYESFGMDRECLRLRAKNANTDGSYTHMHWGFADIDLDSWKPIVNDSHGQWEDFKKLDGIKRILSFGGWAYSTEPATYRIIRAAIIDHREVFSTNLAQFVQDEGIDGIDIDWEYPGAPDIFADGEPIGKKGDGVSYLKFLTLLKDKLGSEKSVSIAAPASFWYLKAFPIDRIAAAIDYIVYMTYDLHGQWDYGNPNAFDSCPSGKCIRSHVNLTETRNALSMITKAGVPNNKIFVGESSYGRSFHMAKDGCWGPMCDFTGSRTQSDAQPGRCTKTGGYISNAEINEILRKGDGVEAFHDGGSNTDVLLYKGDYVSYMTPTTKDTRRQDWKGLDFAGSIDWAVDLQAFTSDDFDDAPDRPSSGEGCVSGEDDTVNSGDLCEFSCSLGFCPESLCTCTETAELESLPQEVPNVNIMAIDEFDVDLNCLCKFACKHGYCPSEVCVPIPPKEEDQPEQIGESENYFNYTDARWQNAHHCLLYKNTKYRQYSMNQCLPICTPALEQAKEEGRTSNYGCVGNFPLEGEIPWTTIPDDSTLSVPGTCSCDNWLVNEIADTIIEAMPIIAQIGCYILMSAVKFVVDVGAQFVPGVGRAIDAGLDMAMTAAQAASYLYPNEEDPEGAFSWWLSPCGGTDLVPDEIKKAFEILSQVGDGISSFKPPKKIKKGSGRKGDKGNPRSPSAPRPMQPKPKPSPAKRPRPSKCKVPPASRTQRIGEGKNTMRVLRCDDKADTTLTTEYIVTSMGYAPTAKPLPVTKTCQKAHSQACFHYSSVISNNPAWQTLTCPTEAATTSHRLNAKATSRWTHDHKGQGWLNPHSKGRKWRKCDRDEYPPAHLLSSRDTAYINAGQDLPGGQLMRFLPDDQNRKAGQMWKGACFKSVFRDMSDDDFMDLVEAAPRSRRRAVKPKAGHEQTYVSFDVGKRPEFSITGWGQSSAPPQNDGLDENPCWPKGAAAGDPGFCLLIYDPWNKAKGFPKYNYQKPYSKGKNGA